MKHIRRISVVGEASKAISADAKADLYNSLWQAWLDYVYTKKNQIVPVTS